MSMVRGEEVAARDGLGCCELESRVGKGIIAWLCLC